jgi:hypothetical protein
LNYRFILYDSISNSSAFTDSIADDDKRVLGFKGVAIFYCFLLLSVSSLQPAGGVMPKLSGSFCP